MALTDDDKPIKRIKIRKNGPYRVYGNLPLVKKSQVVSEYGEPLTWKFDGAIQTRTPYYDLCRCGYTKTKPFCDLTHIEIGFDGTETMETSTTKERQETYPGGTGIVVKRDNYICMESGFCANRFKEVYQMLPDTDDTTVRSLVMAMIERCPSGSYLYALDEDGPDIEPDLPQQAAESIEITSGGPIEGPLWVTGNVPIERSDGEPFETRNRVTLCCCGHSRIKPLCDGTHRTEAEEKMR